MTTKKPENKKSKWKEGLFGKDEGEDKPKKLTKKELLHEGLFGDTSKSKKEILEEDVKKLKKTANDYNSVKKRYGKHWRFTSDMHDEEAKDTSKE